MLRNEYNSNRWRKGSLSDITGFGTPVPSTDSRQSQDASSTLKNSFRQGGHSNASSHGSMERVPFQSAPVRSYLGEQEIKQVPHSSCCTAGGNSTFVFGDYDEGLAQRYGSGAQTGHRGEEGGGNVVFPSMSDANSNLMSTSEFGRRSNKGPGVPRANDSGNDIFGRSLLRASAVSDTPLYDNHQNRQTCTEFENRDMYGRGIPEMSSASECAPHHEARDRSSECASDRTGLNGPRYGRRSGGTRVSNMAGGEMEEEGAAGIGGVSSEQLNRTRTGRRRFDENQNGNRIY